MSRSKLDFNFETIRAVFKSREKLWLVKKREAVKVKLTHEIEVYFNFRCQYHMRKTMLTASDSIFMIRPQIFIVVIC